jgi:hypothetical protein
VVVQCILDRRARAPSEELGREIGGELVLDLVLVQLAEVLVDRLQAEVQQLLGLVRVRLVRAPNQHRTDLGARAQARDPRREVAGDALLGELLETLETGDLDPIERLQRVHQRNHLEQQRRLLEGHVRALCVHVCEQQPHGLDRARDVEGARALVDARLEICDKSRAAPRGEDRLVHPKVCRGDLLRIGRAASAAPTRPAAHVE